MKKILIVVFTVLLSSVTVFALSKGQDKVVATYSGGNVTEQEVMNQFKPVLDMQPQNKGKKFSELDKNIQEALIKGYINIKLIDKEAKKLGIHQSKEFKAKVKAATQQMLQQELIERKVRESVTQKMIDEEYKKLVESYKNKHEVKVSHILVDTEEKAKEIKKKLNKGANFNKMAQEFSKDEGSKANGGELAYTIKGQLVPEFENKAFSLKKNEISSPVKTQFGWHIIKLLDKRKAKLPPKEQAHAQIKANLSRSVIETYFKELTDKADIKLKLK